MLEIVHESDIGNTAKENISNAVLLGNSDFKPREIDDIVIKSSVPDNQTKEKLWNLLVYKDYKFTLNVYESYMRAFNRHSHYKKYNREYLRKKFFSDLMYVNRYHSKEYTMMFYKNLNPSFIIDKKVYGNI